MEMRETSCITMENYLPHQVPRSWKIIFRGAHILHSQKTLCHHQNKILSLCKRPISALLSRLNDEKFWTALESQSPKKEEIEECRLLWQKTEPLAHLDSKKLLSLLTENVLPLERLYQQTRDQLLNEKMEVESNQFWPTHWLYSPASELSQLEENQERLQHLKSVIHDGLLLRCNAHTLLKAPRNVDDIVAAICTKINQLSPLNPLLTIPVSYVATLDDDRRLAVYDLLEEKAVDKDQLSEQVLSPIPKRGYHALRSAEAVKNDLNRMTDFRNETLAHLDEGRSENESFIHKSLKRLIPSVLINFNGQVAHALRSALLNFGLLPYLLRLWSLRYFLYLTLSFMAYNGLIYILGPVLPILIGGTAFGMLSNVLFYGLAMAPLWYLGSTSLHAAWGGIRRYLTHWKRLDIYESLSVLVASQEYIANNLSQVIVDIPNFDIQALTEIVKGHQARLETATQSTNRFYVGEKLICRGGVSRAANLVLEEIKHQQRELQTHLKQLADHIASRIGQDIELLQKTSSKQGLEPILPHQQLKKLRDFVISYGDDVTLREFEKNANVLTKWAGKIDNSSVAQNSVETVSFNQPWGGHAIRKDYLRGWETILKAFIDNPQQREAALQINALLMGRLLPTQEELHEWITALGMRDARALILQTIQAHLFNTLDPRRPENARLLSEQHNALITNWYRQHEDKIHQAPQAMSDLFSNEKTERELIQALDRIDDKALSQYYELLDGADIYNYSVNNTSALNERRNLARKYFEGYTGETSKAIRFVRFLPDYEKSLTLVEIAQKRLGWLLRNIDKATNASKPFDDTDAELFHNYALIALTEKFNFPSFIYQSPQFSNPWNQHMEDFLGACQKNGFDSGGLLKKYKANNIRIKPFMLHQRQNSMSQSCGQQERKTAEDRLDAERGRNYYVL